MTHASERGAVLVEFALVALTLSLLLAATIEFGRMLFYAQALQDAARVFARELSVTPLAADATFDTALASEAVIERIYDRTRLVVDVSGWTDADYESYIHSPDLPIVNRALLPLMIIDRPDEDGPTLWRYPGALLTDTTSPTGVTVGIPRIDRDPGTGAQTITWVPVVEEINPGHFGMVAGVSCIAPPCGVVAVRLNYPYQAGAISAHIPNPDGPAEPTIGNPVDVDETLPQTNTPADVYGASVSLMPEAPEDAPFPLYPVYAGRYGLGQQTAYGGRIVRPFRRLLSAQVIYRREVIGD
ncbi:MAG TPA: TadE/TadG family type IV pilus assembly protein [Vicinamibacterales bacterium]